jgi:amidophosphoribosyltransferase
MRPLCIGQFEAQDPATGQVKIRYCLASETCALNIVGATYVREVLPGEIIRIDEHGLASSIGRQPDRSQALCIFEYVYLARPDSYIEDQLVYSVRQRLGKQLAIENPANADVVIGVPDSSLQAAMGYAQQSGIPYLDGLIKNRYIYRTFIQPTQKERKSGIDLKFNPLVENIKGKRVVLVDDSIVRGNTLAHLLKVIRKAGATEIHVRISSPPIISPCFMVRTTLKRAKPSHHDLLGNRYGDN